MSATKGLPSGLVTFLFTDIEGSTRLAQKFPADYRGVLADHRAMIRRTVTASRGVVMFEEGDSVFAVFQDASDAIRACTQAQRALSDHDWPKPEACPQVRMGLHSGFAEPSGGEYATPEVHRASRVANSAHGGQVLCSASTARLAMDLPTACSLLDLGLYKLRGFDGRERLFQLVAPGLGREFPRPRTGEAAPHNLPVPSASFVGRRVEIARVRRLLEAHRLVSVVGPGGMGKTRLALEAARLRVDSFRDGVWFIDLAAVSDGRLVALAIAEVLGVRPEPGRPIQETLTDFAGVRELMLLLDTCDAHPEDVRPLIERLLGAGPGVRILATSREPLATPGEAVWRIPPMSMREINGHVPDALALLLDRAEAARGGREVGPAEIPSLMRVIQRLDGLPLAIELAAARLGLFSPAQLADRIDDLLATLDGSKSRTGEYSFVSVGRHRHGTVRATVDWSYRTLPLEAAALLRSLSVFAGPIDLAAIEWFAGPASVERLATLVDKSLVAADPGPVGSEVTYRMLHPIRAVAVRALVSSGEETAARDRHLQWVLHMLDRCYQGTDGKSSTTFPLDELAVEVRAALKWCVAAGRIREGLRLAVGLDDWWRERGLNAEGRLWLQRLIDRLPPGAENSPREENRSPDEIPATELAVAYHVFARHVGADGDFTLELRLLVRAEEAAWASGQAWLIARVAASRGEALASLPGRGEEAERACRAVIQWAGDRGVEVESLPAVFSLAQLLWRRGKLAEAATVLNASRSTAAAHPTEPGRRSIDMLMGLVAISDGDLITAHDYIRAALRNRMTHGYHWAACEALSAMAVRCALGGEMTQAATLFGASKAARDKLRSHQGAIGPMGQRHEMGVRNIMGEAAFEEAYAVGAAMTLAEATAYALEVGHPDPAHGRVRVSIDTDPTTDLSHPTF